MNESTIHIQGTYGEWYDEVTVNGKPLDPSASQHVRNHSPDGFAWGYGGSGPAQLALAILLLFSSTSIALANYQRFKNEHVANWPQSKDFDVWVDISEYL